MSWVCVWEYAARDKAYVRQSIRVQGRHGLPSWVPLFASKWAYGVQGAQSMREQAALPMPSCLPLPTDMLTLHDELSSLTCQANWPGCLLGLSLLAWQAIRAIVAFSYVFICVHDFQRYIFKSTLHARDGVFCMPISSLNHVVSQDTSQHLVKLRHDVSRLSCDKFSYTNRSINEFKTRMQISVHKSL